MKEMPPVFFLSVALGKVPCLTHWIAAPSSSTLVIGITVSHMHSTQ